MTICQEANGVGLGDQKVPSVSPVPVLFHKYKTLITCFKIN